MSEVHNARQIFPLKRLSKRCSFWSNEQANDKTGHQTAEMGRRADLGRRNVEQNLDDDDEKDVEKTLLCLPNVAMANEKSGPGANNSHHATGCANELGWPHDF